ncbi:sigma 54-interacting transcriptional regulator [bacterium]|nr:sigma 54-interacting transcriptional regulator [bacterium]
MQNQTHEIWNLRFLNQIMNSMADGVFTMDARGKITSWNRSMERISGYSAEEALGRTCEILGCSRCFGRECPAGVQNCGILERGSSETKECQMQHKQGHDVAVIKNASVVRDKDGTIIGIVETVTDLTELKEAKQKAEMAALRLGEIHQMGNIIGKGHEMQKVFVAIKAAAASGSTILIQGESGTGKELVAGAIHYQSDRSDGPLVIVNCSALSESLLESELFGHVKGAYTGAMRDRIGRFEEAQEGTIFLDEIGELSPFIQVKLLRVLQEREVERVGESRKRKINIRVIAATHRDLYQQVCDGLFREDLYYRLKVFPIHLPPLRNRKEDIPLLVDHFTKIMNKRTGKNIQGVTKSALRMLMDYSWKGNVRELENAVEHAFVLCDRDQIDVIDLPAEIRLVDQTLAISGKPPTTTDQSAVRKKLKKEELLDLLDQCDWNKSEVGRRLNLSHSAFWKYMKKWDIPLKKGNDLTLKKKNGKL